MSQEVNSVTNGIFTLQEADEGNVFYFYRNDDGVLGDVGRMPMDFYQEYVVYKMMTAKGKPEVLMNEIYFETSKDGKCIRLTATPVGEVKKQELPEKKKKEKTYNKWLKRIRERILH